MSNQTKQQQWQHIITQWEQSDLSVAAFCRQQDLNYEQFFYWKNKRTDNTQKNNSQPALMTTSASAFTRVTQVETNSPIQSLALNLPGGLSISGLESSNIHLLGDILRQL